LYPLKDCAVLDLAALALPQVGQEAEGKRVATIDPPMDEIAIMSLRLSKRGFAHAMRQYPVVGCYRKGEGLAIMWTGIFPVVPIVPAMLIVWWKRNFFLFYCSVFVDKSVWDDCA